MWWRKRTKPSSRLFERDSSLDQLVTNVNDAIEQRKFDAPSLKIIACNQLRTLCPNYEPSRVMPDTVLCRSGEDSHGYQYRPECTNGCIVSQFSRSGVFTGEEEATPSA